MPARAIRFLSVLFTLSILAAESSPISKEVSECVKELASSSYDTRDVAKRKLLQLGAKDPVGVYEALPKEVPDLEASIMLKEIRIGLAWPCRREKTLRGLPEGKLRDSARGMLENPSKESLLAFASEWKSNPADAARSIAPLTAYPEGDVSYWAVVALADLKDKSAVSALTEALMHGDTAVRRVSLSGLADVGDASAARLVALSLEDEDAINRQIAAETLGKLVGQGWPSMWKRFPDGSFKLVDEQGRPGGVSFTGGVLISGDVSFGGKRGEEPVEAARAWWEKHKDDPEFQPGKK